MCITVYGKCYTNQLALLLSKSFSHCNKRIIGYWRTEADDLRSQHCRSIVPPCLLPWQKCKWAWNLNPVTRWTSPCQFGAKSKQTDDFKCCCTPLGSHPGMEQATKCYQSWRISHYLQEAPQDWALQTVLQASAYFTSHWDDVRERLERNRWL